MELASQKKKVPLKLEFIREIYAQLNPAARAEDMAYRKENPLHRLYYHDITPPEKLAKEMKSLGEWLESTDFKELHAIDRAAEFHWRLMRAFPWSKESGRLARILSNFILESANYPLAILHSIDRQRYYEGLREGDSKPLLSLYLEAVETTAESAIRVYEEAARAGGRRAS